MMTKQKLLIVGAGGLGKEVADIAINLIECPYESIAFLDDNPERATSDMLIHGLPIIGTRSVLHELNSDDYQVVIGIGDPNIRAMLAADIRAKGFTLATLVDSSSIIRNTATIAAGSIVGPAAVVSTDAMIESNVVVNAGALVGHDAIIGESTVINPGAQILGAVTTGHQSLIGAGAVIHPLVNIGAAAKVAMASAVYKNVPEGAVAAGNPARIIAQP